MLTEKIGKYRWTVCALLFFATTVNYLDRQVLSLLKSTLETEFNWTNSDYANIEQRSNKKNGRYIEAD